MLYRMAAFVAGDGHRRDGGLVVYALRKADDPRTRIVVVAERTGDGPDLDILQAVVIEHATGDLRAGQAGFVGNGCVLAVRGVDVRLRTEANHHRDDNQEKPGRHAHLRDRFDSSIISVPRARRVTVLFRYEDDGA